MNCGKGENCCKKKPAYVPLFKQMGRKSDLPRSVKIPIIGTGSVLTGRDAIELMMAGATLVGIGTAVYYRGVEVFAKIANEMIEWCEENGVKDLSEIIGKVH